MFVHSRARELGLKGWVRNLADGRVEAVARGSADQLKPFENAIRTGPSRAIVESVVTADWNQSSEFADFTVERDGAEPCS